MRLGDSGGGSRQQMSSSKYGYLIKKKILTNEQIIQAILQSRSLKKSVEQVLLDRFRIEKTDILDVKDFSNGKAVMNLGKLDIIRR